MLFPQNYAALYHSPVASASTATASGGAGAPRAAQVHPRSNTPGCVRAITGFFRASGQCLMAGPRLLGRTVMRGCGDLRGRLRSSSDVRVHPVRPLRKADVPATIDGLLAQHPRGRAYAAFKDYSGTQQSPEGLDFIEALDTACRKAIGSPAWAHAMANVRQAVRELNITDAAKRSLGSHFAAAIDIGGEADAREGLVAALQETRSTVTNELLQGSYVRFRCTLAD